MRTLILALGTAGALTAAALTPAAAQDAASGTVINAEGAEIGTVSFQQTPHGVLITADVEGLPEGVHGFHIHETGACDAAEGFSTAGGHYAGGKEHGFLVDAGPHAGDMPNVHVGADGHLVIEVLNTFVSVDGEMNPLLDDDGSALMIHAGADDYQSAPSGDAGGRIACAVIE